MAKKEKKTEEPVVVPEETDETVSEQPEQNTDSASQDTPDERDRALAEAVAELDKTKDLLMRTAAEYDNFRRRTQKEKEALYTDSKVDVLSKLLPVMDNFDRAASVDTDFEQYRKGIEMIVKQMSDTFTALGAESFGEAGEPFNPNLHNGVMHIEDENLGENVIAQVFIKGYRIGERVIRPASVQVAN